MIGIGEGQVLHLGPVEEGVLAAPGAVDDLVGDHKVSRGVLSFEGTDCSRRHDAIYAEFAHRPHIGAYRDRMRGELVTGTVAGMNATGIPATSPTTGTSEGDPYGVITGRGSALSMNP